MQKTQQSNETINISREKLVSLISQTFGGASGNPNPEEPQNPDRGTRLSVKFQVGFSVRIQNPGV